MSETSSNEKVFGPGTSEFALYTIFGIYGQAHKKDLVTIDSPHVSKPVSPEYMAAALQLDLKRKIITLVEDPTLNELEFEVIPFSDEKDGVGLIVHPAYIRAVDDPNLPKTEFFQELTPKLMEKLYLMRFDDYKLKE